MGFKLDLININFRFNLLICFFKITRILKYLLEQLEQKLPQFHKPVLFFVSYRTFLILRQNLLQLLQSLYLVLINYFFTIFLLLLVFFIFEKRIKIKTNHIVNKQQKTKSCFNFNQAMQLQIFNHFVKIINFYRWCSICNWRFYTNRIIRFIFVI